MKNVHYGLFLLLLGCPDEDKFAPMVEIVDMGIVADAEQRNTAPDVNTAPDANTVSSVDQGQEVDAGEQDAQRLNDVFEDESDASVEPKVMLAWNPQQIMKRFRRVNVSLFLRSSSPRPQPTMSSWQVISVSLIAQ